METRRVAGFASVKAVGLSLLALGCSLMPAEEVRAADPVWDSRSQGKWSAAFEHVSIPSSKDGKAQEAFVHWSLGEKPRPLLISLHTWGGNFTQDDPLAALAAAANWNYIHPDFRGANTKPEACMSPLVVSDLDDAIALMLADKRVDKDNVFLVGVSGGGYAACGMFFKSRHTFRRILAWVPISDLGAWYEQCLAVPAKKHYAMDVLACVGGAAGKLNQAEAQSRSPLFMDFPANLPAGIDIYAGVDDGWKGSVPISQSLLLYNRLAENFKQPAATVSADDIRALCDRTFVSANDPGSLGDRKILYTRGFDRASVTIFQGGHEMLSKPCFEKIQALAETPRENH